MKLECGFEHGFSMEQIQLYAKPEFNYEQMQEIRYGFEHGFSMEQVQLYAKPEFSSKQMRKIRGYFEDGLSMEIVLSNIDYDSRNSRNSRKKYNDEDEDDEYDDYDEDEDDNDHYNLVATYDNNNKIIFYKIFEVGSEEPYIYLFDEVKEAISVAEKNENASAVIIFDYARREEGDLLVWTKEEGELDELREPDSKYYTNETKKLIDKIAEED